MRDDYALCRGRKKKNKGGNDSKEVRDAMKTVVFKIDNMYDMIREKEKLIQTSKTFFNFVNTEIDTAIRGELEVTPIDRVDTFLKEHIQKLTDQNIIPPSPDQQLIFEYLGKKHETLQAIRTHEEPNTATDLSLDFKPGDISLISEFYHGSLDMMCNYIKAKVTLASSLEFIKLVDSVTKLLTPNYNLDTLTHQNILDCFTNFHSLLQFPEKTFYFLQDWKSFVSTKLIGSTVHTWINSEDRSQFYYDETYRLKKMNKTFDKELRKHNATMKRVLDSEKMNKNTKEFRKHNAKMKRVLDYLFELDPTKTINEELVFKKKNLEWKIQRKVDMIVPRFLLKPSVLMDTNGVYSISGFRFPFIWTKSSEDNLFILNMPEADWKHYLVFPQIGGFPILGSNDEFISFEDDTFIYLLHDTYEEFKKEKAKIFETHKKLKSTASSRGGTRFTWDGKKFSVRKGSASADDVSLLEGIAQQILNSPEQLNFIEALTTKLAATHRVRQVRTGGEIQSFFAKRIDTDPLIADPSSSSSSLAAEPAPLPEPIEDIKVLETFANALPNVYVSSTLPSSENLKDKVYIIPYGSIFYSKYSTDIDAFLYGYMTDVDDVVSKINESKNTTIDAFRNNEYKLVEWNKSESLLTVSMHGVKQIEFKIKYADSSDIVNVTKTIEFHTRVLGGMQGNTAPLLYDRLKHVAKTKQVYNSRFRHLRGVAIALLAIQHKGEYPPHEITDDVCTSIIINAMDVILNNYKDEGQSYKFLTLRDFDDRVGVDDLLPCIARGIKRAMEDEEFNNEEALGFVATVHSKSGSVNNIIKTEFTKPSYSVIIVDYRMKTHIRVNMEMNENSEAVDNSGVVGKIDSLKQAIQNIQT